MVLLMLLVCAPVKAIEKLEVQGLFSNKAVLMVDGVMRILKVGDTSPEGIKLVSLSKSSVELSVDKYYIMLKVKLIKYVAFRNTFTIPSDPANLFHILIIKTKHIFVYNTIKICLNKNHKIK